MTAIPAHSISLSAVAWPHLWATTCSCRRHRWFEQIAQPDQVVGDHMQAKHCTHLFGAAQPELTQPAPLFDPAKHLLDAAAGDDRLAVALMAGGAAINGGTTRAGGVLGHMRCDADAAHLCDKPLGRSSCRRLSFSGGHRHDPPPSLWRNLALRCPSLA